MKKQQHPVLLETPRQEKARLAAEAERRHDEDLAARKPANWPKDMLPPDEDLFDPFKKVGLAATAKQAVRRLRLDLTHAYTTKLTEEQREAFLENLLQAFHHMDRAETYLDGVKWGLIQAAQKEEVDWGNGR